MSNDKTKLDKPTIIAGVPPIWPNGDPSLETIIAHEVPHGLPGSGYNGDNLFYDRDGFHGRIADHIIDGVLAPVKIFSDERELHSEVYQAEVDAKRVFWCGNHALVAQGQHLAGIWEKKNLEFRLVPEDLRIAEPPTYADIRKD